MANWLADLKQCMLTQLDVFIGQKSLMQDLNSKRKIGTVSLKKLLCETALSVRLRNLERVRMLH